uniref:Transmembrane ascorbate-dependent reductase CYB561 n=1 Tax=Monodelphis domestica TaxID=13616 RepID=F6XMA2_MONDO
MEASGGMAHTPTALPYFVALSQVLGLTVVAVTGAWLGLYRGGLAWEGALQFNVHPLCMVIGMIFLQGDALLVYRVFRNEAKRTTKILHGLLHVFALIIALVGLVAVFEYHKKMNYADLYSLHSWCGLLVFVLYFVQWLMGFSFFLFPGATFSLRNGYRPQHVFFGATLFLLSVGTALLGIEEALIFGLNEFQPEGVLANVLEAWGRPPRPEEQALSMDFKTLTEGDSPGSQ